jgi:hypothetical protein
MLSATLTVYSYGSNMEAIALTKCHSEGIEEAVRPITRRNRTPEEDRLLSPPGGTDGFLRNG